jgi:hypothetical protein
MPAKKKKSKAKRKPVVGRGGDAKHAESGDEVDEQQQKTLNSQMRRLKIADEEAALLEEAIQLAAVEKKEIENRERENCTHGFNPSSRSEERLCEDYVQIFVTSFNSAVHCGEDALSCLSEGYKAAEAKYKKEIKSTSKIERIFSQFFLSAGTKSVLDGNYDGGRISAMAAKSEESISAMAAKNEESAHKQGSSVDCAALMELFISDEHTLVNFFRKRSPCSCLDDKYEEVKSIPKTGYCCS